MKCQGSSLFPTMFVKGVNLKEIIKYNKNSKKALISKIYLTSVKSDLIPWHLKESRVIVVTRLQ